MGIRTVVRLVWVCSVCSLCVGYLPAADLPDEVPFVEGQPLPEARPGEGWKLICYPARYRTETEQVEVSPASSYLEAIPAKWESKEETILVKPECKVARAVPAAYKTETFQVLAEPEHTHLDVVPAKYEWVDQTVLVQGARQEIRTIPAQFHTETEQIEICPAHTYWKKLTSGDGMHCGDSFCMCEIPAKYMTVTKQVLDRDATTETVDIPEITKTVKVQKLVADADVVRTTIPAKYVTMERQVLDTQATASFDTIPAKYETITKQVLVEPESTRKIDIPAKYETVTRQVLDQPEQKFWKRIKCECGQIVKKYCGEIPGTDEKSLLLLKKK